MPNTGGEEDAAEGGLGEAADLLGLEKCGFFLFGDVDDDGGGAAEFWEGWTPALGCGSAVGGDGAVDVVLGAGEGGHFMRSRG